MNEVQNELDFSQSPPSDRLSDRVLEWLGRSYETMEEWKIEARNVFFSANGDSNLARNRVAAIIRAHFLESPPEAEDVQRWSADFREVETVHVDPPKVSASNSAYVDWLYAADYLLLACASISEELEEENQRRETEFQNALGSYKIRLVVHDSREKMQQDPSLSDDEVLAAVKKKQPDASKANVLEARRLEKSRVLHAPPKEPLPAQPMSRYASLYF